MITNTGKNIMAKYLIGQAPSYASHIAVGCGATPVASVADLGSYNDQQSLEFEMFRAPIISRGYVKDGADTKIVFTAELPTQERYEITEIGLYSAGSNPSIPGYDSRVLYSFSRQEQWRYGEDLLQQKDSPLDNENASNDIDPQGVPVFQTNATNKLFANVDRQARGEQCRFLNNMVMIRGDFSSLAAGVIDTANSEFIGLSSTSLNIGQNAPTDKIKLAFSVINREGTVITGSAAAPDKVHISIHFITPDSKTAKFDTILTSNALSGTADFDLTRYYVSETQIKDIVKDAGFFWSQVNLVKIYACVEDAGAVSEDFYVSLDAVRLDNVTSLNPIYGLTGYTPVVNEQFNGESSYASPIVKLANTSSFIEFRLGVDI